MTRKKKHSLVMTLIVIISIALIIFLGYITSESTDKMPLYVGVPIIISLAVSIGYTYDRVYKLSNVDHEEEAQNYCQEENFNLTLERDVYLRSVTTREKISDD